MRLTSDFLPLPVCLMANHKLPMVFGGSTLDTECSPETTP
jgi:hypothetical protein